MALLFFDGFDHYGNGQSLVGLGKWATAYFGTSANATTAQSRTGGASAECPNYLSGSVSKTLAASGGFVVGFALRIAGTSNVNDFFLIHEGGTDHLQLLRTAGNTIQLNRGGTAAIATGATVLAVNTWYYLEFAGTIHDTTGSYTLKINGVVEFTATNVDTRNGGATGQWDRIEIRGTSGGGASTWYDDLYVCDTSGAAPRNTFLGQVAVDTLLPQTDAVAAGSNAGLTPSTGTDHGALVDEVPPNTTDYNEGATVGLKDTYNYPSLALSGTILGVQTNLYVAKSDATARQVCAVVRAGGVDYDGANVAPTTTFAYYTEIRAQNPNTAAEWTAADITALQAGMKVTA